MATSIPLGAFSTSEGEASSVAPVDTDIESPPTFQSSQMGIDGLDNVRGSSLKDKDTGDSLMPPPEIEYEEVGLPPLTKMGETSELPRVFGHEIPDSEAVSDRSSIEDGRKHDCGQTGGGDQSSANPAEEAPAPALSLSSEIAPEALTMHKKGEEMEQTSSLPQLTEPGRTKSRVPEQEDIVSQAISDDPEGDAQLFNNSSIEDNKSNVEPDMPALSAQACTPPISKEHGVIVSKMATAASVILIESVSNISSLEPDESSRVSSQWQDKVILSTITSSSQVKVKEGDPHQTMETKKPSSLCNEPVDGSHNKDIMMTELKAMKIVSQIVPFFLDILLVQRPLKQIGLTYW